MSSCNSCGPKTPLQEYALRNKQAVQQPSPALDVKNIEKAKAAVAVTPAFKADPNKVLDIQA